MIESAKFIRKDGIGLLLCSKCSKVIKTQENFNTIERFAFDGQTTLSRQYCNDHKYLSMFGNDKKREMLRRGIKEKLREAIMKKNVLEVYITRPTQKLVIMRGIPGSGKSTQAKKIVGEGVIHSTDDLIEATGNYNGHFAKMTESGDWSEHGRMHHKNFLNAKESMERGVSPVVVDNTNIKANEAKKYVEAALKLGLSEDNIIILDVGNGGQTAEILAERNTHSVPLNTIQRMMASHKGVGELTVTKILESKGGIKESLDKVLYAAVVLEPTSHQNLVKVFASKLPEGWKIFAHHMTIVFGKGLDDKSEIGKEVELTVTDLGMSDMAMAVKVEGYPTANDIPHVTIAVNTAEGGKPFMSNKITNWGSVDLGSPLKLYGIVTEIKA